MGTNKIGAEADVVAFVSVADLKADLGIAASDTAQDDALSACLLRASAMVERFVRRTIAVATFQDTIRIPRGECREVFLLGVWPIVSIEGVSSAGGDVTPSVDGWDIEPDAGMLYPPCNFAGVWPEGRYSINYRAGWVPPGTKDDDGAEIDSTIPPDVAQATLETARSLYFAAQKGDPLLRSESEQGVGSSAWFEPDASGLPPAAAAILTHYLPAGIA